MPQSAVLVFEGDLPINFQYYDATAGQTVTVLVTFSGLAEAYSNHPDLIRDFGAAILPVINASNDINDMGDEYQLVSITKLNTSEDVPVT